ncbi:NUDIX domain-containing protein [Alteromonas sp. CYL-A6]|uniref:NUDIX domain-containing protein n=1 Tax=Alteromonas nitratireducens TaxID=3390813 RepID=UPI0034B7BF06
MKKKFLLSSIFAVLPLFGCDSSIPPLPACRTAQPDSPGEAAGCLIYADDEVLLIGHRLSGRLDVPGGGRNAGETLPCTAHRETFEETGLNVFVGERVGSTDNGMVLYACVAADDLAVLPARFSPPPWAQTEVSHLEKTRLFTLDDDALRFKDDLIPLRDAFIRATTRTPARPETHNQTPASRGNDVNSEGVMQ